MTKKQGQGLVLPVVAFLWLFVQGATILAQVTTGNISGKVQDETGAVVPGASLTVRNVDTGMTRTLTTDAQGRYRASSLSLGNYEVRGEMAGFQVAVRRGIELTLGREAIVDLTLQVGSVAEAVEVTGEAPLVDTVSGAIAGLVTEERITALPLNGRDLAQLMSLEPGVTYVRRGGSDVTGGFGKRMAIAGARPDMTGWALDGTDVTPISKGGPGSAAGGQLGVESVREFQVLTNAYTAEYGGVGGGTVNAVSKSGTNQFHGTVYAFHRNDNLDANNFFNNFAGRPKAEFKRNQFGSSAGGPIVKDRTFFYGNYEGLRERRTGQTRFPLVPTAERRQAATNPVVQRVLSLYPLPTPGRANSDLGNGTGEFLSPASTPLNEDYFMARVDHSFSPNFFVFGRYTFDTAHDSTVDSLNVLETGARNRHQYATVEATSLLSAKWLNKLRAGFNRSLDNSEYQKAQDISALQLIPRTDPGTGEPYPANFSVSGMSGIGLGVTNPRIFILNHYELGDDVGYSSGRHNAKFGMLVWQDRVFQNQESRAGGQWSFRNLADFLAGRTNNFDAPLPGTDAVRNIRQWLVGFHAQDSFSLLPRLNLNLGLRYEFITVPTEIDGKMGGFRDALDQAPTVGPLFRNPSLKNFAPRVGFAWDPVGDGKSSVRGGFGIFYDQVVKNYWRTAVVRQPPFFIRGALRGTTTGTEYNTLLAQGPGSVTTDLTSMDYNISTPYLMQYNLNIQRQLTSTIVATVGYAGSRGVHLFRAKEGNSAIPQILQDGRKFFPLNTPPRNPTHADDRRSVSDALSRYNALLVGIRKRFTDGLHIQSSWTWSKAIDEGSALFSAALSGEFVSIDPDDHTRNRGLALFDVRHNWITNFLWELPWGRNLSSGAASTLLGGWQLGAIGTLQSGTPDTPVLGFNNSRNQSARNLFEVPNLKPGASTNPILDSRDVEHYYDASVFSLPDTGFFGNLGRNTLIGPGVATLDLSLYKTTGIPAVSESFQVEFRAEFFNILNRANFSNPDVDPVLNPDGTVNATAGRIRGTTTDPRQIQVGLKLVW